MKIEKRVIYTATKKRIETDVEERTIRHFSFEFFAFKTNTLIAVKETFIEEDTYDHQKTINLE